MVNTGSLAATDVTVNSGATLGGDGSVAGDVQVQSGGTVAPGAGPMTTGVFSTGNLALSAGGIFDVEVNSASDFDRLAATGTVDLTGSTLQPTGTGTGITASDAVVIIDNDGADPVVGEFNALPEGAMVAFGGFNGFITYQGGDGNDVALIASGDIVFDGGGTPINYFELRQPTAGTIQLVVGPDSSNTIVFDTRPLNLVNSYTINGGVGNDLLNVNYGAAGGEFNLDITFNGESQSGSPGDTLEINGGTAETLTFNYTNANDGNVEIDFDGGGVDSTITYTGLETDQFHHQRGERATRI